MVSRDEIALDLIHSERRCLIRQLFAKESIFTFLFVLLLLFSSSISAVNPVQSFCRSSTKANNEVTSMLLIKHPPFINCARNTQK